MSTNVTPGNGSIRTTATGFAGPRLGSARPSRPGQLSEGVLGSLAGGADPQAINELAHTSAAALLDKVRHSEDPEVVQRVVALVENVGVDEIAELWSSSQADTLPGIMWRLYMLRTWMRKNRADIATLWRLGETQTTAASAIAGVSQTPDADDIARTADSILSGAFTGDFAVALERANAFVDVVAAGLRTYAHRMLQSAETAAGSGVDVHTRAARLMHTAGNLAATSQAFAHGARLWRAGTLE